MKYLDLIGLDLKNDALCDLFETYDVEVIYEYDRTHEGLSDEYRAEITDLGVQFVFNEKQIVKTLFIKQIEINSFNPFEKDERLITFNSKVEAMHYASENNIKTSEGNAELLGDERDWVRFEHENYSIHYEY